MLIEKEVEIVGSLRECCYLFLIKKNMLIGCVLVFLYLVLQGIVHVVTVADRAPVSLIVHCWPFAGCNWLLLCRSECHSITAHDRRQPCLPLGMHCTVSQAPLLAMSKSSLTLTQPGRNLEAIQIFCLGLSLKSPWPQC